nr:MAG: polyprotein 1 [Picornavirales sp.]
MILQAYRDLEIMFSSVQQSLRSPQGTNPIMGRQDKPEKPACGKMILPPCKDNRCVFECIYCSKIVVPSPYDHPNRRAETFDGWCEERFLVSPPSSPDKQNKIKNKKALSASKQNKHFISFPAQSGILPTDLVQRCKDLFAGEMPTYEPIAEYVEICWLLYADIQSASDNNAKIRAFAHAIKHIFKRSIFSLANDGLVHIANICMNSYSNLFDVIPFQGAAEDTIDKLLNNIDRTERSQILAQFGRLLGYVLSFAAFKEYNIDPTTNVKRFKDFSHILEKKPLTFTTGLLRTFLETIKVTLTNLKKFWLTGDASDLLFTEDRITKWSNLYTKLKNDYIVLSNPEPFGVSVEVFEKEILACIEEGKFLSRNKHFLTSFEMSIFERRFQEILTLERDFKLIQLAQGKRDPPLALLINGPSSVGKSSIMHMLFAHFAKVSTSLGRSLDMDESYMYTRSVADEYWSGFNSYQWCIVLDDVAVALPSKAVQDPTLDEIIRVVNPMPWTPPQAELERKGRYPVCPKLFLASTNVKDLNASMWFSVPIAIQRRFPYVITVVPKTEFTKKSLYNTNPMLDTSNLPGGDGYYDDYWRFTVERTVPGPLVGAASHRVAAAFETVLVTEKISEFMQWYGSAIKQYYTDVSTMRHAISSYANVEICTKCFSDRRNCLVSCSIPVAPLAPPVPFQYSIMEHRRPQHHQDTSADQSKFDIHTGFLYMVWSWFIVSMWNCSRSTGALAHAYKIPVVPWLCIKFSNMLTHVVLAGAAKRLNEFFHPPAIRKRLAQLFVGVAVITLIYKFSKSSLFPTMSGAQKVVGRVFVKRRQGRKAKFPLMDGVPLESHFPNADGVSRDSSDHEPLSPTPPVMGGVFSSNVPKPYKERANIWTWKEKPVLTNIDLTPAILSRGALSVDEQVDIFARNCFYMTVQGGASPVCFGRILAIGGQLYLTNAHFFQRRPSSMFLSKCSPDSAVGLRRTIALNYGVNVFLDEINDIAIVRVIDLPSNRSLLDYMFPTDNLRPEFNGRRLTRQQDGSILISHVNCNTSGTDVMVTRYGDELMLPTYRGVSKDRAVDGDCGSPLIAIYNGRCILAGLHVGCIDHPEIQDRFKLLSRRIDRQLIEKLLSHFPAQSKILPSVPLMTSLKTGDVPITTLHYKSPFGYLQSAGSMEVFGSIPFREGTRSHVIKTLLCEEFVTATYDHGKFAIIDKMHPPIVKGYEPKHQSLQHMIQTSENVDYATLDKCKNAFLRDIFRKLPLEELDLIKPLDMNSCVNGIDGVAYIDAMKRGTSAGFPWRETKLKHLRFLRDEAGNVTDKVEVTEEIASRVEFILERYQRGEQYHPIFSASFKDEPVSLQKRKAAKTRIFCAAPMDFTIVVRKFLLPVIRVIQRNSAAFETAVGVQAQSKEWELKYKLITKFGTSRIVAGDYSKFDKKMSPSFTLAAFDILREMCKRANYSSDELLAIDCIAQDICFPTTDFFGDLVRFNGTNPSGHPLTVIINSLVNSLYMRYAYYRLNPNGGVETFQDHVSLVTYGDDNIMSVREDVDFFNHTSVQEALQIIGVEYTMPNKEQHSLPFVAISDVTFLKRSFRFDDTLGGVVGPLEHDSISKMLTSCVASKAFTAEQHMLSAVRSAMDEYFWYGQAVFEDRRKVFHKILLDNGLYEFAENQSPLPTWVELLERYNAASEPFETDDLFATKNADVVTFH